MTKVLSQEDATSPKQVWRVAHILTRLDLEFHSLW